MQTDNNTSCKDCIFAEYEGITQVSCKKNMLDKYTQVIEAYDEDKEFFVIFNRKCPNYRPQKWLTYLKSKLEDNEDHKDDDINSVVERMMDFENSLIFHVMVFVEDGSLEGITKTLQSLKNQIRPPSYVTFFCDQSKMHFNIYSLIKQLEDDTIPFKWKTMDLLFSRKDHLMVNLATKNFDAQYYSVCKAGYEYEQDFFNNINKAVIDHAIQFAMIEPEEKEENLPYQNGSVVPYSVHEFWLYENESNLKNEPDNITPIPEKLREFQCQNKDQKVLYSIKEIQDILSTCQKDVM